MMTLIMLLTLWWNWVWKIGAMINPLLYTYSDWQKRNFTPFYKNVEQESIEICR